MPRALFFAVVALLDVLRPAALLAQEAPRVGLVMAFPAAVGVTIRISDRLAIRPMVGASKSSTETTTTITVPIVFPLDTPRTTTQTTHGLVVVDDDEHLVVRRFGKLRRAVHARAALRRLRRGRPDLSVVEPEDQRFGIFTNRGQIVVGGNPERRRRDRVLRFL